MGLTVNTSCYGPVVAFQASIVTGDAGKRDDERCAVTDAGAGRVNGSTVQLHELVW
jgi:hypothetical protein